MRSPRPARSPRRRPSSIESPHRTALTGVSDALEDVRIDCARAARDRRRDAASRELRGFEHARRRPPMRSLLRAALGSGDGAAARAAAAKLEGDCRSRADASLALCRMADEHARGRSRDRRGATRSRPRAHDGSPRDLRDVAVADATLALTRGDTEGARTLAAFVEPYATDDFAITLLLARVTAAAGEGARAGELYEPRTRSPASAGMRRSRPRHPRPRRRRGASRSQPAATIR